LRTPLASILGAATVLPGMIDVHVHLNWYFGPGGKYGEPNVPAGYATDAVLDNARKTLLAGFTTVQSLGAASDRPLRDAIAAGIVPGRDERNGRSTTRQAERRGAGGGTGPRRRRSWFWSTVPTWPRYRRPTLRGMRAKTPRSTPDSPRSAGKGDAETGVQ
jgi:hypothetical protein